MKIACRLIAAIALSCPPAAFAADLPTRALQPLPPPVPAFTWGGLYVGGQLGYDRTRDRLATATGGLTAATLTANPSGVVGGMHLGYNMTNELLPFLGAGPDGGGLLLGLEGDVDITSAHEQSQVGAFTVGGRDDISGSFRGRLGYAFGRTLLYATGGIAFAGIDNTYQAVGAATVSNFYHNRAGYTVGAGLEYAITNHWSVRAEYRYSDYGRYSDAPITSAGVAFSAGHNNTQSRAQAGFSYKFDPERFIAPNAPVVAKY